MPSSLSINTALVNNKWEVTAEVVPGGILPSAIFVHENTGTDALGNFYGTANMADLGRMQVWEGSAIPTFGNKFVLHTQAKIIVDQSNTPTSVINALVANVTLLSTELQSINTSTQNIIIP